MSVTRTQMKNRIHLSFLPCFVKIYQIYKNLVLNMPGFFECSDVVLKKFSVLLQCFHPGGLVTGRLFTVLLGQYVPVRCTSTFCMLQSNFVKIKLRHAASVLVLDMHTGIFLFPKITGYLACRKAALVIAKCSFWNK